MGLGKADIKNKVFYAAEDAVFHDSALGICRSMYLSPIQIDNIGVVPFFLL